MYPNSAHLVCSVDYWGPGLGWFSFYGVLVLWVVGGMSALFGTILYHSCGGYIVA